MQLEELNLQKKYLMKTYLLKNKAKCISYLLLMEDFLEILMVLELPLDQK